MLTAQLILESACAGVCGTAFARRIEGEDEVLDTGVALGTAAPLPFQFEGAEGGLSADILNGTAQVGQGVEPAVLDGPGSGGEAAAGIAAGGGPTACGLTVKEGLPLRGLLRVRREGSDEEEEEEEEGEKTLRHCVRVANVRAVEIQDQP